MTSIAPVINELLNTHDSRLIQQPPFSIDNLNAFLREAYQINKGVADLIAYLRSIRQPYLSGAPPPRRRHAAPTDPSPTHLTNAQRDQIDADAKATLRDLHAAVNRLSQIEKARQDADAAVQQKQRRKTAFGALSSWAAGGGATGGRSAAETDDEGRAAALRMHREGVVWYLQRKLEECGTVQGGMMEIRIAREMEKSKSVLYKIRGSAQVPVWGGEAGEVKAAARAARVTRQGGISVEEMERRGPGLGRQQQQQPDEEQMQLFARENQDMLKQYEDRLDQVRTVERSLIEISELQSTLVGNLEVQSAQIDRLTQDSFQVTDDVGSGNKELKKASERKSTAKAVFYGTTGLCVFLVAWDLMF